MRIPSRAALFTAFVAGQAAGVCMLGVAVLLSVLAGRPAWQPLQVLTGVLVGEEALQQVTVGTLLPGLFAHQTGPTVFWSRLFGLTVGFASTRLSLSRCLLLGVATGVVAMLADVYLLMPHFQQQLHGQNVWAEHIPRPAGWAIHLAFGLALGALYGWWQPRGERERGAGEDGSGKRTAHPSHPGPPHPPC